MGGAATGGGVSGGGPSGGPPVPVVCYYAYNRSFTGGPRTVLRLLRRLDRARFRPILASQVESSLTEEARAAGVETHVVPLPAVLSAYDGRVLRYSPARKLRGARAVVGYNRRIEALARDRGARLVWARGVKSVLLTGLAARRLRAPLVWDIGLEKRSGGLVRALQWAGLALADRVVTQADAQREQIFGPGAVRVAASKFTTIRPGIDPERLGDGGRTAAARIGDAADAADASASRSRGFTILNVGSVHPRKNQLMLLRVAAGLAAEHPGLRVRIAGEVVDEGYARRLREFAAAAGCGSAVELLGWRDDVAALIRSSDVLVHCATMEGVPTVVREAMHLGTPVVATAVGGVPETIEHGATGFLVPSGDDALLRSVLRRCIARPDELAAVAGRARDRARSHHSVGAWAREYNALLGSLCSCGPAARPGGEGTP